MRQVSFLRDDAATEEEEGDDVKDAAERAYEARLREMVKRRKRK